MARGRLIGAVLALLVGPIAMYLFRPQWIVAVLAKVSPRVLYFVETQEPVVALTIDDGPDPTTTPRILDVLRDHGARATFFLITDRVPGNEDLVTRIVREGHEIANHTTSDRPTILLSPAEFEQDLLEAHGVLSQFADVHWFRPGSGWYTPEMLTTLQRHGYRCALGSVYPFDPQIPSAWFAAHYILWNVRPGSVIVLHDHGKRGKRTAEALSAVLDALARRGYRVVTLSELVSYQGGFERLYPRSPDDSSR